MNWKLKKKLNFQDIVKNKALKRFNRFVPLTISYKELDIRVSEQYNQRNIYIIINKKLRWFILWSIFFFFWNLGLFSAFRLMFVSNLIYIVLQVYLIDLKLFNKQDNLAFEIRVKNQQYLKYEYQKNRYKKVIN